jgi:hypothetical protein
LDNIIDFSSAKANENSSDTATPKEPTAPNNVYTITLKNGRVTHPEGYLYVMSHFVGVMKDDENGFSIPQYVVPLADIEDIVIQTGTVEMTA